MPGRSARIINSLSRSRTSTWGAHAVPANAPTDPGHVQIPVEATCPKPNPRKAVHLFTDRRINANGLPSTVTFTVRDVRTDLLVLCIAADVCCLFPFRFFIFRRLIVPWRCFALFFCYCLRYRTANHFRFSSALNRRLFQLAAN